MSTKNIFSFLGVLLLSQSAFAQNAQPIDRIVAQVGNSIILESEINERYEQEQQIYVSGTKHDAYCHLVYTSVAEKVLANMAREDSVLQVSDAQIEMAIERQIEGYLAQVDNNIALLEQHTGRTLNEMRRDFKPIFDDLLHAQNAQEYLVSSISITPKEVKEYFNAIPTDSLELIPAMVEVGQINMKPEVNPEVEDLVKEQLEDIRNQIVKEGKSFATMASIYGQDGTAKDGGLININKSGSFDPHFVAAAFRLQKGEVSPVTKSRFGYHLIKMEEKHGDQAVVRHIVLIPQPTRSDLQNTTKQLDSLKTALEKGEISFTEAVNKHSSDINSKFTNGMIVHPQTKRAQIPLDALIKENIVRGVGEMEVGTYSDPVEGRNQYTGEFEVSIYYLKSKTEAHVLNLKDDYALIQDVALEEKKNDHLQSIINREAKKYYIKIDEDFQDCELITPMLNQ